MIHIAHEGWRLGPSYGVGGDETTIHVFMAWRLDGVPLNGVLERHGMESNLVYYRSSI